MSSGGSTNTVQKSDPWSGQAPYLSNVFGQAQNTYNQFSGNPSSAIAPFNPQQQQAFGLTQQQVGQSNLDGAQVNNAAGNYTTSLLNGDYLGANPGNQAFGAFANGGMLNNPYEQGMANAASTNLVNAYQTGTAPQTTSEFEGAGRYGSGAMTNAQGMAQQGFATQLGNAMNNLYGNLYQGNMSNMLSGAQGLSGNYNNAAQQQLQGSYNAPSVANQTWNTIGQLSGVGGQQQALSQAQLQAPWSLLNNYSNLVQGQYGGTTSTQQPYFTNPAAGALGGAAAGAMLGTQVMPGWGTAVGAGAGLLLGGLG